MDRSFSGGQSSLMLRLGAFAFLVAAVAISLLTSSSWRQQASASGSGWVAGTASVVAAGQPMSCTYEGELTGGSTPTQGSDAVDVGSSIDGTSQCSPVTASASTGSSYSSIGQLVPRLQEAVLNQTFSGDLSGQIIEQNPDGDMILETPADGSYELDMTVQTETLGAISTNPDVPMLLDCPNIEDLDEYTCSLTKPVALYGGESGNEALLSIEKMELIFDKTKPPVLGTGGPPGSNDELFLASAIAIALGVTAFAFIGAAILTRRRST